MATNRNYPRQGGSQRSGGYSGGGGDRSPSREPIDPGLATVLKRVNLTEPHADMFDKDAQTIAFALANGSSNKSSQIRRFYDELLRYKSQVRDDAGLKTALPFIRMLNARAAYAGSRKPPLVDKGFQEFLRTLLDQVKDKDTLRNACTTFEAVIGFRKGIEEQKS